LDKTQALQNMQIIYKIWPLLAFGAGLLLAYLIIYKLVTSDYSRSEQPIVTAEMLYHVLMNWDGVMGESLRQAIIILGPVGIPELIDHLDKLPKGAKDALLRVWEEEGYLRKYFEQAVRGATDSKIAAIEILGKLAYIDAVNPLLESLGDRNDEVRLAASEALSKIHSPEVIPILIKALEDPFRFLPARIAEIIMSYGEAAVAGMLAALPNLPIQSKVYIIEMLGSLNNPRIPLILMNELYANEVEVRTAAIDALGAQNYKPAAEAMTILLKDKEWRIRSKAAKSLGIIGSVQSIPSLHELLKDGEWWVRTNAESAIENLQERLGRG
jgi:HEAT repeat protein